MSRTSFVRPRESHPDCDAYNAAFHELGLEWSWDQADYAALAPIADEKERIAVWLKTHHSHLLKAYEPGFLVDLIYASKQQYCEARDQRRIYGLTQRQHAAA